RARYAGYTNAASFKAWVSVSTTSAYNRIFYSGPWYRPDGVQFATRTHLTSTTFSGRVLAPLYQAETGAYLAGNGDTGSVWTATYYSASYYTSTPSCLGWTSSSSTSLIGRTAVSASVWQAMGTAYGSPTPPTPCRATVSRLYCLEDTP